MRIVADTNIIISAFFLRGSPRRIIDAARDDIIELYTSNALLTEIESVLSRKKFKEHIRSLNSNVDDLIAGFSLLSTIVEPYHIEPVIKRDPVDDQVLACALAAECEIIVSGDDHLLSVKEYRGIRILTAKEFLDELFI